MDKDCKIFYNNYNKHDEDQSIDHNHRKLPEVHCTHILRNLLIIHLINDFSSDPDAKYFASGSQQSFVPDPVAFLAYQPHIVFSA